MADKKSNEQPQQIDLLDVLLDQENREPIVLMDEKGKQLTFEQVAVIPYGVDDGDKSLYCVLKPMDKIDGIADDEAIVFLVDEDADGNTILRVEENEEVAIAVFDKYYDLLEEATKKPKKAPAKKETSKAPAKKPASKTAGKTAGKPKK